MAEETWSLGTDHNLSRITYANFYKKKKSTSIWIKLLSLISSLLYHLN